MNAHENAQAATDDLPPMPAADALDADGFPLYRPEALVRFARAAQQRGPLLQALQDVLKTRNAEAKAATAYTVAHENFGDARSEAAAHTRAMVASSAAEARARAVIALATA